MVGYLKGWAASAYLFTAGVARPKDRAFIHRIGEHVFGSHEPPAPKVPELPIAPIKEIVQGLRVQIADPISVDGNTTTLEQYVFAALVERHRPKTLFEVGTFDGRTTLNLAVSAGPEAKLFTLDLPPQQLADTKLDVHPEDVKYIDKKESGARFKGTPQEKQIEQLWGDSATFDFTPYAESIDFVFIDGSHAYDYVLNDSNRAWGMTHAGSVILWHDYANWDDVTRALDHLRRTDARFESLRRIEGTSLGYMVRQ